ncbi:AlpA family phage regulatory protein [Shewanella sp. MMG014]|uniref:helix-turn-helix transcriptional regulator n=1 Tax=Shewanella sp. MMG014 TaxID=2822691 RepID=UPI001B3802EF|nr:AlpA family phage regulatory protein [Shewanella sp. MMG014]MBQ4889300.1 AlpA family phage regulatory protein [Shewanella sp. MMG014]
MKTSIFTPSADDSFDEPVINEEQRCFITTVSRSQAFQLERNGQFPTRIKLNANSNVWKLREVLEWIRTRPVVKLKDVEVCNDTN